MRGSAILLLVAFAGSAIAAPPTVTAPGKVYGEVGDWVEIKVETPEKSVKFVILSDGLKVFPAGKLKDEKTTFVKADKAGRYSVLTYTGNADGPSDPAITVVTFGSPPADDGSKPKPPGPVEPIDPYAKAIIDAYRADTSPDKRERAGQLAAVMTRAVVMAGNESVLTNDVLAARVSRDTKDSVGDSLKGVRQEVGKYLAARLPSDVFNLNNEHRATFRAAYSKAAAALGAAIAE